MADYTAAAKAAIKARRASGARKRPAAKALPPVPANTPLRHQAPPTAVAAPARPKPRAPQATQPPRPTPQAPAAKQAARASARPAPAKAPTNTGPYAGALNALDTEGRQITDVERRRLDDNQKYQEWLNAGNDKAAAQLKVTGEQQAATASRIQAQTSAAQAQIQKTLDAQRGERAGTVTDGPGNSRARLAGDDTLTQSLLAGEQQRAGITSESIAQKAGFLAAATAATGAADAARIRGESGTQLADVGRRKGDLLVHQEDTLSAERAARAAAAADAIKAQLDADQANRAIDARLAIADATLGQRASDNAAQRALAAQQGRATRRSRQELAKQRGSKKGGVSPAEQRQRANDARDLDDDIARATAAAKAMARGGKKKDGTKIEGTTDPDTIRAGILALYPDISADALDAAVDAVTAPGGVAGAVARRTGEAKRKKARRKRLQGR